MRLFDPFGIFFGEDNVWIVSFGHFGGWKMVVGNVYFAHVGFPK